MHLIVLLEKKNSRNLNERIRVIESDPTSMNIVLTIVCSINLHYHEQHWKHNRNEREEALKWDKQNCIKFDREGGEGEREKRYYVKRRRLRQLVPTELNTRGWADGGRIGGSGGGK